MRKHLRLLLPIVVLALVAAACGTDDDSGSGDGDLGGAVSRSAGEIEKLWEYLQGRLYRDRPMQSPVLAHETPAPAFGALSVVGEIVT